MSHQVSPFGSFDGAKRMTAPHSDVIGVRCFRAKRGRAAASRGAGVLFKHARDQPHEAHPGGAAFAVTNGKRNSR